MWKYLEIMQQLPETWSDLFPKSLREGKGKDVINGP